MLFTKLTIGDSLRINVTQKFETQVFIFHIYWSTHTIQSIHSLCCYQLSIYEVQALVPTEHVFNASGTVGIILNTRQATANTGLMFAFSSTTNIWIHFSWANKYRTMKLKKHSKVIKRQNRAKLGMIQLNNASLKVNNYFVTCMWSQHSAL